MTNQKWMHSILPAVTLRAATYAGVLLLACATAVMYAQAGTTNQKPANDLPNPYQTVSDWAKVPAGIVWGATGGVAVDKAGHIWVLQRCGGATCADASEDPIFEFDKAGKFLKSFGSGMFVTPHGLTIDGEGNIWATDFQAKNGKGMQMFKFSPDGKLLMTLGRPGLAGPGEDEFQPVGVAISPKGEIFIADGHGQPGSNNRIVKLSREGKFIKTWGITGSEPGQFNGLHAITFDGAGRLLVADRGNNRIQIFDQEGKFITEWKQFGRPGGIYVDGKNNIYVADSDSNAKSNPGWQRGIRIGSATDGSVKYFIPDPNPDPNFAGSSAAEGVAADEEGNVYGAEVAAKDLKRYVKK